MPKLYSFYGDGSRSQCAFFQMVSGALTGSSSTEKVVNALDDNLGLKDQALSVRTKGSDSLRKTQWTIVSKETIALFAGAVVIILMVGGLFNWVILSRSDLGVTASHSARLRGEVKVSYAETALFDLGYNMPHHALRRPLFHRLETSTTSSSLLALESLRYEDGGSESHWPHWRTSSTSTTSSTTLPMEEEVHKESYQDEETYGHWPLWRTSSTSTTSSTTLPLKDEYQQDKNDDEGQVHREFNRSTSTTSSTTT